MDEKINEGKFVDGWMSGMKNCWIGGCDEGYVMGMTRQIRDKWKMDE